MSTRATYEFRSANCHLLDVTVCFYIHSDGYPEGAAENFYLMHDSKYPDNLQDYASQFFRINKSAEFTKNRDAHIDTEYHYIFSRNETLSVFERESNNRWLSLYKGHWLDFVNQHQQPDMKLYRFDTDFYYHRYYTMTLKEARAFIENKKEESRILEENGKINQAKILLYDMGYLKGQIKTIEEKIEND
ncbi:MAG: hypothetical protein HKM04_05635 [Legionellales bacterium]|nr:hypothetical protein [Legionellales bacterium]